MELIIEKINYNYTTVDSENFDLNKFSMNSILFCVTVYKYQEAELNKHHFEQPQKWNLFT